MLPPVSSREIATDVPFCESFARHYLTDSVIWALYRPGRIANMDTLMWIAVVAGLGIAVAGFVMVRRNRPILNKYGDNLSATAVHPSIPVKRNSPPQRKPKFDGVSVRPGVNCCDAVKAISRERYLQGEAPSLPLPGCDRQDCRCIMRPEDDRRSRIDRRDDAFSAYGDYRPGWGPRRRHERKERRER